MNKPLVIYHGNCSDGFAGAWVFWKKFGDTVEYYPGVYSKTPPDCTNREVYLVDFSYKRNVTLSILEVCKGLTILDHHETAIREIESLKHPKLFTVLDRNRSGSMVAWNYLFPNQSPPLLLGHIEDRDLWKFKLPHTREIQANVFSYEYTFENYDRLMQSDQIELLKMTASGAAIERKHQKDVAELIRETQRSMRIAGYLVSVVNVSYMMASDAVGQLAKGQKFAASYYDNANQRTFSLRSDENGLDVSRIAEEYGGGGHIRSSAFRVPRDHILATS